MKKKILRLITAVSIILLLESCGKENDLIRPAVNETMDESEYESIKNEEPLEPENGTEESDASQTDSIKTEYYSVVEQLYRTYTLPDGTNLGNDGIYPLSNNKFAINDIDQDGKEELLIVWTTTCLANNVIIVYDFDSISGKVRAELREFPSCTFYDNGVVEVNLSHNHGLSCEVDDFWPYTFYQYDQNTDVYAMIAEVDAWEKTYFEKDYNGKPFPDDSDVDGDGIVYKITIGDDETFLDLKEYKEWRDSFIGEVKEMKIPFVEMTEDSIQEGIIGIISDERNNI